MHLSIIIVNWNVRELLRAALKSIYQYPPAKLSFEVIVVDNASADNSSQMVAAEFPQVKLISSPQNLGFAGGNNLGLKIAQGSVLLLLNPDTEVHAGTLEFIHNKFGEDPSLGALGVKLLNSDGTLQPSCKSFPNLDTILWNALSLDSLFPKSKIFGKYNMTWFDHLSEREVEQPMGAALAIRREVMTKIGIFDEQYFMYFDEVDWCYRIKQAGWKIKYFPQVSVTHHWGQSTKQLQLNMNWQWYKSFYKYLRKNYRYPKIITILVLSAMIWLKLLILILLVFLAIKFIVR